MRYEGLQAGGRGCVHPPPRAGEVPEGRRGHDRFAVCHLPRRRGRIGDGFSETGERRDPLWYLTVHEPHSTGRAACIAGRKGEAAIQHIHIALIEGDVSRQEALRQGGLEFEPSGRGAAMALEPAGQAHLVDLLCADQTHRMACCGGDRREGFLYLFAITDHRSRQGII
ncbi:hypothetical protein HY36_11835 [Hyphomonas atlantica]|uniref:Uncharacterized protein n=1 Tax=Hyphomonas atlantica TaxID=1280948 RepID=A0A059DWY8_9PROT|nr:hypothetical protein HY36_11835 [Hyphomonas atlantica]